jgi:hypothetical protein
MISVILLVVMGVLTIIAFLVIEEDWRKIMTGRGGFAAVFVTCLLSFLITEPIVLSDYNNNYASIKATQNQIKILEQKANELLPQFKYYLISYYPGYEKKMIEKISLNNINMILLQYPNLKTLDAVNNLVDRIEKQTSAIYDQKLQIEVYKKNIVALQMNPFIVVGNYKDTNY